VLNPVGEMRMLYEKLDLGAFENYLPRLEEYLRQVAGYERNRYEISPELGARITKEWGQVIRRYGYTSEDGARDTAVRQE
jgi:omega-hydroxy-beta-dihydromenaquinone-9 sulfotransferase